MTMAQLAQGQLAHPPDPLSELGAGPGAPSVAVMHCSVVTPVCDGTTPTTLCVVARLGADVQVDQELDAAPSGARARPVPHPHNCW